MKFMLDTNICIYIIKKHPETVHKKFKSYTIGDICISSITLAELEFGVQKSLHKQKNHDALQEFILPLEILAFDENAATNYGILRTHLEKAGTPIGALDLLIAAHANSLGLTIITNNKKEFSRIPNLKIQDWVHDL